MTKPSHPLKPSNTNNMKILAPLAFLYLVLASTMHAAIGIVTGMFGPVALGCICIIALDILSKKTK